MKKISAIVSILVVIVCSVIVGLKVSFPTNDKTYFISSGCDMISFEKKERLYRVNYQYCHFMNDGSFLAYSAGTRMVYHFDKNYNLLWSKLHHSHYEFFVDEKNQRLYTFGSANHEFRGSLTRFDTIRVIDIKTGELIQVWDSFDQKDEILAAGFDKDYGLLPPEQREFFQSPPYAATEFSHFNSIALISHDHLQDVMPSMKEGNLLICLNTERVIAVYHFEKNKIIDFIVQDGPEVRLNGGIHDVKFFNDESIYYYRNSTRTPEVGAQIVRYHLRNKKREVLYSSNFKSELYGGMDLTHDGGLLVSHNDGGPTIVKIDLKTKQQVWEYKFKEPKFEVYRPRELELSSFMKNNRFLDPILTQN